MIKSSVRPGWIQDFKLEDVGEEVKKEKNNNLRIHIVLINYKYIRSLFLDALRCNHLPTKTKKKKIVFVGAIFASKAKG